ncbi:MAG: oxidoreductase [Verrucomicrobia bacterium]|nr:oxidoreductase [Verrucomicrobiota bacterium]
MLLNRQTYFIKEHAALLKLTDTYDILDPETQAKIGIAKEQPPGWAKILRLLVNKKLLPTTVNIYENENEPPQFSIHRGFAFSRKVRIVGANGEAFGHFQSKLFSLGGGFNVFDPNNQQIAEVKGDWKGWNFKFIATDGRELGTVTKKWAGIGKELFTSADNYVISLSDPSLGKAASVLLLAAGLAIDVVFKEKN